MESGVKTAEVLPTDTGIGRTAEQKIAKLVGPIVVVSATPISGDRVPSGLAHDTESLRSALLGRCAGHLQSCGIS